MRYGERYREAHDIENGMAVRVLVSRGLRVMDADIRRLGGAAAELHIHLRRRRFDVYDPSTAPAI